MPIFVTGHVRAGHQVKSYTRGTSKLSKTSRITGLPKLRLVESRAYQQFKSAQEMYSASGGGKNFSKMARKQFRHRKLTNLRKRLYPGMR